MKNAIMHRQSIRACAHARRHALAFRSYAYRDGALTGSTLVSQSRGLTRKLWTESNRVSERCLRHKPARGQTNELRTLYGFG